MSPSFDQAAPGLGTQADFHHLSLRRRTVLSQAPLVATTAVVCAVAAWQLPAVFDQPRFLAGLALLALITAVAVVVPWNRLWYPFTWVLPILDFAAIELLHHGGRGILSGLSLLTVFPVFWLAWSRVSANGARLLSVLGSLYVVWFPALEEPGPTSVPELAAPILVPLVNVALAVTVSVMRKDMTIQQQELNAKDRALEAALAHSRQYAELLDVVLNAIDVGVLVVDESGSVIHKNRRMQVLDDRVRPPGRDNTQEEDLLMFQADQKTPVAPSCRPVARALSGEHYTDFLIWMGTPGDQLAISCAARQLTGGNGLRGAVITFSDTTALVEALRTESDFVSNVSHELRTPLTSIIGYLDLAAEEAEDTKLTGTIPAALLVAQRNSRRLLDLVSDLLTAAGGSTILKPREVPLAGLVAASVRSSALRAAAADVELFNECPEDLLVYADPARLAQVLENLLSNAIKYSPDGGPVTVRAWETPAAVCFSVTDSGMGMSEPDQQEVFGRFFRTGTVRQAGIPGAGLGMAISKGIVEAHGGSIELQSALGKGTTFTVTLPREGAVAQPDGPTSPTQAGLQPR